MRSASLATLTLTLNFGMGVPLAILLILASKNGRPEMDQTMALMQTTASLLLSSRNPAPQENPIRQISYSEEPHFPLKGIIQGILWTLFPPNVGLRGSF